MDPDVYAELAPEDGSSTAFTVAELSRDPGPVTANMKAPVIQNHVPRSDIEVVFDPDRYSTEYRVD